jgi:pimeloyl-ACP methyl ester carboxylesterase
VTDGWHRLWTASEWGQSWSIEPELPAIRCPVLVCHDRRDELSPPLHAEAIAAALPAARLSWWDTGRHDPHLTDRSRLVDELGALWEEAERAGG